MGCAQVRTKTLRDRSSLGRRIAGGQFDEGHSTISAVRRLNVLRDQIRELQAISRCAATFRCGGNLLSAALVLCIDAESLYSTAAPSTKAMRVPGRTGGDQQALVSSRRDQSSVPLGLRLSRHSSRRAGR